MGAAAPACGLARRVRRGDRLHRDRPRPRRAGRRGRTDGARGRYGAGAAARERTRGTSPIAHAARSGGGPPSRGAGGRLGARERTPPARSSRPRAPGCSAGPRWRRPASEPTPSPSSGARNSSSTTTERSGIAARPAVSCAVSAPGWSRAVLSGAGGGQLDALSRREREVAQLVTARKTNKQVAAELFLSEKTVETHLRNIFAKLGASSRVDVARAVERSAELR